MLIDFWRVLPTLKCLAANVSILYQQLNCLVNRLLSIVNWILMSQFSPNHYDVCWRVLNHCVCGIPFARAQPCQIDTRNKSNPQMCWIPMNNIFSSCHISNGFHLNLHLHVGEWKCCAFERNSTDSLAAMAVAKKKRRKKTKIQKRNGNKNRLLNLFKSN